MTERREADIAVIGGGLAGLLAASRLAGTGRSVVLAAPPRPADRRTTALLGGSVDAIKSVGAWPSVASVAQPLRAIRLIDVTGRLIRAPEVLFSAEEVGREAFGYNVPNEALLTGLETAADAAGVETVAAMATSVQRGRDVVTIGTEAGIEINARLAVASDGRSSPTRASAGIAMSRQELPQTALVCNVAHELPHDDVSTEFHTANGPFTLVPMADRLCGLVWVTAPEEARRLTQLSPLALADAVERQSHAILGRVEIAGDVQTFPLAIGMAERFAADRLVLAGEAAHVMPPIAAQGFNVTVRDIETLVELVAGRSRDCGSTAVTESYRRNREPDARLRVEAVRMVNGSLLSDLLPSQLARGAGLFALANLPPLRRLLMREGLASAQ
jgi:2-octaprenyl-6-methoxyphenol hydroxylase